MIEKLIEASARNKLMVLLLVVMATAWGVWALFNTPLDAIPDLSDVQVIVFTEWPGRSPDIIEDQITYPIVTSLLAAPKVQFVRGQSFFGLSFVYAIFEDGTDMYWARSRVLEYMNEIEAQLPEGVTPTLGPDATGVGWVFEYALVDTTGRRNLANLRSFQDWNLKYWLEAVPGVAEVASVGGFVKQYQIDVDPNKLLAYNIPLERVIQAVRDSNNDVGGRVIEMASTEFMLRGRGYIQSLEDIETTALGTDSTGTPIYIRNVAHVHLGPDMRRGIAELDGKGEVVGGIVVMRYGENSLKVIERVKEKIEQIKPSLPPGMEIVTTYDRSDLISRAIQTLSEKLTEEMLIVSIVIILFLFHFRSALIAIITLPIAVVLAFIPMKYMGLNANIMSLGGIAIAIGAMVDAAIVLVENTHKSLERWEHEGRKEPRSAVLIKSLQAVGKPIFFSLLVITVSFLPIFTLEAQEGRLFKPLAYTKTFSMLFAAILAVTLGPALIPIFVKGKIRSEKKNPISRVLIWLYEPVANFVLRFRKWVVLAAVGILIVTVPIFMLLGTEFMPPLNEGSILYMPTSIPGMPASEAKKILHIQDKVLATFPEVERVFGKIGRARTATDPAPLSMVETTISLKPKEQWRPGMTWDGLIAEMDKKLKFPGMANIWWMPIQTRTEMLTTGIRSNLGIKVFGDDLREIERVAVDIEQALQNFPGTRSAFAERTTGGYFIDFKIHRQAAARYGLTVGDVQDIIQTAIGGMNITQTVEGRERYPVNVRYPRELRDDLDKLKRVLVPTPTGAQVPIVQLADIFPTTGPPMIRNEDGSKVGFVFVDVAEKDYGSYVREAQQHILQNVDIPPGYTLAWAGQYKYLQRLQEKLKLVIPVTILLIFMLLYFNFKSISKTMIVLLSVPFSVVGAVWLLWILGYNTSVAVWVGIIALAGVAAETGVVMIVYLDEYFDRHQNEGRMNSLTDLREAIIGGAVQRVRPKMMTVGTTILGLLPIMWSAGTGADVMKRIAAPMVGGLITSTILTLVVIPAIYALWRERHLPNQE
ncbi:efflux RND transporter permease subunit [candidate division KSB1 bacterium]|nr:efflux RND transporter permease subunit [candidate division KSB1 bacterium]NIR71953.1 efflux RND transporter permease subunit [candidate division KSB1 bacterium]NIS24951.1 efflux RND transporter permease subunit [candidate division KSB1 bacterium]NIT71871.1 efflux RND transporter permease subunit [candidate division KSB1 bacterium]NIU25602.1 efflux RND transporter permease subunit [candidate division KSB1 bacterium]